MKKLIARNLACVGVTAFGVCTALALFSVFVMCIGMIDGEWALLHVLAMAGIATGFMLMTAVCMAVAESLGAAFWRTSKADD